MEQIPFPFKKIRDYSSSSFVVTPSNRLAYDYLETWPKWPTFGGVIQGAPYSGKTHLASLWKERASAQFLTPETIETLQREGAFLSKASWIIDGLEEFLPRYEISLFHLFNSVRQAKGFLLITSTVSPSSLPIQLPDLRSRLSEFPILAIQDPDDLLFLTILSKEFSDRQLTVDPKVLDFISKQVPRTFNSLKTLPDFLSQKSFAEHHDVTIPFVKRQLF